MRPNATDVLHILIIGSVLFAIAYVLYMLTSGALDYALNSAGVIRSIDDDLRTPSPLTARQLDAAFEEIGAYRMVGLGRAFKRAEADYGVNAAFLAAVAVHESGKGTSRIATEKYNLFGWGARDSYPFVYAYKFDSWEHGIDYVAKQLRVAYFDMRRLTTLRRVGERYASDNAWAAKVLYWVKRLQEQLD